MTFSTNSYLIFSQFAEEVYPDRFKQCKVSSNGLVVYDVALSLQSGCNMDVGHLTKP